MSGRAFAWLDVFTDRPFAGNPLAVVPDADGLDSTQMQRIAFELGLAETVFVSGGAERLRIFTPRSELPLAGHPVVGASLELARLGRVPAEGRHVFQTAAGQVPVELAGGRATMTQGPLEILAEVHAGRVAAWLGLEPAALAGPPRVCTTTGIAQLFAQVRDRDTLADLQPNLHALGAFEGADGLLAWCEHGDELAQRFFAPGIGIGEDAATGSAAGALVALRVHDGAEPGAVLVRQGAELGRPSELHVTVGGSAGAPDPPRVGGRAVLVLDGVLRAALG